MYPYTAKRRDVLGNTSPEDRKISRGRGFCTPRTVDVVLIFALGSVSRNIIPRAVFPNTLPREQVVYSKM